MKNIVDNICAVRAQITQAAQCAGRAPQSIQLLAVSKTRQADELRQAFAAGQQAFGENYLQEGLDKIAALADLAIEWHFIGPIQSNKTRPIAEHFHWVHSVDRTKVARRLSEQRPANLAPLNICLQVNISAEASKSGCLPADAMALAREVAQLPRLRLRGLMAIPAATDDPKQQQQAFGDLRKLLQRLQAELPQLDTLSMGMSADLEAAIGEGASIVRIGTAIFGPRNYSSNPQESPS
ncbi:YggS family pyridoxal phosphate-dependent enzyme [Marinobacterium rhizophilum]|uniref:Pyridoxal phosphate homeostasis protein n=1 Tax=Marinobacterium rhizophilum TaxID=420402 RepID=A0ABY5HH31_9GAMM|nr:YggS family pyridoxal phosphate-dependent enzyme [Marinobacterium rhizophilum]UTW10565.1 YggS family pyridoxal phosphate-dependent enzyme [Marinobacterium rhizophilum]